MSGFSVPSYLDYSDGEANFKELADSFTRKGPIRFKPVSGYYTAAPADTDVVLRCDGTTEIAIPADVFGSDSFTTGAQVAVLNYSEKRVVIEPADGVTINGPERKSIDRWRWGVLVKQNANLWLLSLGNIGGGDAKGVPLPPKITACFGISAGATVLWDAPVDDGGSPITQYIVEQSTDEKTWTGAGIAQPEERSETVNDLKVGTKYFFRVKAVNANGISDPSNVENATPTQTYNDAEGGTVSSYIKDGRYFRVHTFTRDEPFRVRKAVVPFRVFVQGGGGGGVSNESYGGGPDGDGGFGKESSFELKVQSFEVKVGAGCAPNTGKETGGTSSFADLLSATGGAGGAIGGAGRTQGGKSDISGTQVQYGKGGYKTASSYDGSGSSQTPPEAGSGSGGAGNGNGAGGGNSGVVIVSYEIAPFNEATGGTVTTVQNYNGTGQTWRVHTFTGNGQLDITMAVKPFNVLVVAGGAGGAGVAGNNAQGAGGGNGGAGGARLFQNVTLTAGDLNVAVGNGGGGGNGGGQPNQGGDGGGSSIGTMSTTGGGGGGIATGGRNGGSGGGGGCAVGNWGGPWGGGSGIGGEGTNGAGGSGNNDGSRAAGGAANLKSNITGTMTQYANGAYGNGGGGGDWQTPGAPGSAGVVIVAYQVADGSTFELETEPQLLNVARVTKAGNTVVNIEQASQEWLNANADDPWFYWVQYDDNLKDALPKGIPFVGLGYDPETRTFAQPHYEVHEESKRARAKRSS